MNNSMTGMNAATGAALSGLDHLRQSISDILTTPVGSRVLRRDYGSRLFELIDRPLNEETRVLIVSAAAQALNKWEPRLRAVRLTVSAAEVPHGRISLIVSGYYRHNGTEILLDGIVI
jgi:phage baseplate assembly protein W